MGEFSHAEKLANILQTFAFALSARRNGRGTGEGYACCNGSSSNDSLTMTPDAGHDISL